jgi:septum site-determining protein MinC
VKRATAARPRTSIRLRGRSLMAFVLAPSAPIATWLAELDKWSKTSPEFFLGKAIILDVGKVCISRSEIAELVETLGQRGIRVMGLENAQPDQLDSSLPPLLIGGRPSSGAETASRRQEPSSLLFENPIRSGQSVIFPHGDVTVLGSVASGAEVVAGGSIHVYGALRGRALAGSMGDMRARIFCSRNEAELMSIDGYYQTADDMDASLRGRPAQCWLKDRALSIAALD